MSSHPQLVFTVGMPNMVPNQLSEVELLKIFGDLQWNQIASTLQCAPHELANDAGERLYPSFVQVEACFGPAGDISRFQEGSRIRARCAVRFYAKQFVEGLVVFDDHEIPPEVIVDAEATTDRSRLALPWVSMTNAFVARVSDSNRLKTFRPAGIGSASLPETKAKPESLIAHERVMNDGRIELPIRCGRMIPLAQRSDAPITYAITPENDLNGAGLVYFARYVAMMNQAERTLLSTRLPRPFSGPLTQYLSTEHRRTFFYSNAGPTDEVLIYGAGAVVDPGRPPERDGPTRTRVGRLRFRFDLYRKLDGVLMASSLVAKALTIPNAQKSLLAEARRFVGGLVEGSA
jgi:probable biosynthetic protein (TIGR04098 family)